VQPAGVSDDFWAEITKPLAAMDEALKAVKPEDPEDIADLSKICSMDNAEIRAFIGLVVCL
jgi:hypothetical protein